MAIYNIVLSGLTSTAHSIEYSGASFSPNKYLIYLLPIPVNPDCELICTIICSSYSWRPIYPYCIQCSIEAELVTPTTTMLVPTTTTTTSTITGICNYIRSLSTGTISSGGTSISFIPGSGVDDTYGIVTLPFNFKYYNTIYSTIYPTTNGYLLFNARFDSDYSNYNNTPLPTSNKLDMIFPYWSDLMVDSSTDNSRGIFISEVGIAPYRCFIIRYKCTTFAGTATIGNDIEFEVRLYETTNNIELVYGNNVNLITNYTVGIQNSIFYDQIGYNTTSVHFGDLFRYSLDGCNNIITTTLVPTTITTTTTTIDINNILIPTTGYSSVEMGTGYTGYFMPSLGFYRNLEADNSLALGDYSGRIRPIQTPIEFVEGTPSYVNLRNFPQIDDLYLYPQNFGFYNMSLYSYPDNNLSGVLSTITLGSYSGFSNCVQLYTRGQSSTGTIGDKYSIYNIYPTGTWRNNNIIVELGTGLWNNGFVVGAAGTWKKQDGTYAMLVTGYNPSGTPVTVKQHLFYSTSLIGPWIDQNTSSENLFNSSYLPIGYIGSNTIIGGIDLGNELYAGAASLINNSHQTLYPSIIMWSEDLVKRGGFNIDHNYTFANTFTPYVSLIFYKNKYYYSLHDGAYNTGKRQVLISDNLKGTYSYHSTILDFSDTQFNYNDGLIYHGSFANGRLFTFANRLYFASSGENMNNPFAGEYSNHCIFIWLYDDNTNTWKFLVGPVITASHSSTLFPLNWGTDHTGYMDGLYVEDDKLWITYALITTSNAYELTNAYFDLSKILK